MTNKLNPDAERSKEAALPWERNFAEQMIRIREERGMTQTELARRLATWGLPFHQQTVQRIEAGQRPVRLNEALLIARELDVSLDSMMAAAAPNARAMMYAVDEMRRGARKLAEEVAESLEDFAQSTAGLALAVDELLQTYDGTRQDPVLKYGFVWANGAWDAYAHIMNGLMHLIDLSEGRESSEQYRFDELDRMEQWWDMHSELLAATENFPEPPSDDSTT